MKTIFFALLLTLVSTLPAFGTACITNTDDHYLGISCGIGDMTFQNFSYSTAGTTPMSPTEITVNPIATQYSDGLLFNAPWGVQSNQTQDSLIGFTVTAPTKEITALSLYMFGAGTIGSGQVSIAETYCAGDTFADMCANGTEGTLMTLLNSNTSILHASVSFAGVKVVDVMKDIELLGGASGSASLLSGAENAFAIPEPGSIFLVGTGVVGLGGVLRRKLMK